MKPITSKVILWVFFIFLAAIFSPSISYSEEKASSNSATVPDEELCKYGSDTPKTYSANVKAYQTFRDLKKVYVYGVLQWSTENQLATHPLFAEDAFTRLGSCILRRHLKTFPDSSVFEKIPLPVIAMTRRDHIDLNEVRRDKNSLYINTSVEWRNDNHLVETDASLQEGHVLTLVVESFRGNSELSPYDKTHYCAADVSYSADHEKFQKSVTEGLQKCLWQRYMRSNTGGK